MRQINRIAPAAPAHAYKTYQIVAPDQTHWRPATCEEVNCVAYQNGWTTTVDTATELGQQQAEYIRRRSGRAFTEDSADGRMVTFRFRAGQTCFAATKHRIRLDRPELYLVRDGDWRGNPLGTTPRRHTRGEHWVEDFAEHQDNIARLVERGR
jgi:hypothetical protein